MFMESSARTRKVKNNVIGSLVIKGLSIVVQLILVPLTLGYVSDELYGIWLTLSSIVVWLNFFDIGFTLGLKNRLAEAIAKEDYEKGKRLVSTTYVLMAAIFIPLFCFGALAVPHIDWPYWLKVDAGYLPEIQSTLYILLGCFCLQMITNVLGAVVAAFQQVALSSLFPVIGNVASVAIIYVLTKTAPPSLMYLALAISIVPIVVVVVASAVLYSGAYRRVAPALGYFDKREIGSLFSLGGKFFLLQVQVVVLYQTTNFLISFVSSPATVTAYNIAYRYIGVAMMVFMIVLQPLWPAVTDAYTKGDFAWMKRVYRKMSLLYLLSSLAIVLLLLVSPLVYKVWIGGKAEVPFIMTAVVAIYVIVHTWDSLQVYIINGTGHIKLQVYVTLFGLIAHVPMSLLFGKYLGLGGLGVVLSMIVVNIVYASCFTLQINKLLNNTAKGIWIA